MLNRPRLALTRQMHFFAEFQKVLAELRRRQEHTGGNLGAPIEDLAWNEALRRRRARLASAPYCAGEPAVA